MASAWAQAAELEEVNRLLARAQLGCWVAGSMHARHIARMDPDVALQVLAPAQARMTRTAAGSRPGTGLAARLLDTGLAPTAFGAALRRVARPRGAIARRAARADGAALTLLPRTVSVLASLQPRAMLSRWSTCR